MSWKKAFSSMKDKLTMNPTERMLKDTMSDEQGGIPNSVLEDIAERTKHPNEFPIIMRAIWANLNAPKSQYKKILRTLTVLETIVKFGSSRAVQEIHDEVLKLRFLHDFSYVDEDNQERGNGIRTKAKYISDTVSDFKVLDSEREQAQSAKQKFVGISSNNFGGFRDDWRPKESYSARGERDYREPQRKADSPRVYENSKTNLEGYTVNSARYNNQREVKPVTFNPPPKPAPSYNPNQPSGNVAPSHELSLIHI